MSSTTRFRRLAGAACLVLGPVLLGIAFAVLPWQTNDDDTLDTLNLTGANITATQIGDLLAFAGILAMIPATLAIMRALGRRAPLLGLVGGTLSIGGLVGAMLLVVSDQITLGVADAPALRPAVADAVESSPAWVLNVVLVVFLAGLLIGGVVLGAGLLRARIVPAWAGVVVMLSPVVSLVAHMADRKAIDVVGSALVVIGYTAVAQRVLATDDASWEAGEIADAAPRAREMVGVA